MRLARNHFHIEDLGNGLLRSFVFRYFACEMYSKVFFWLVGEDRCGDTKILFGVCTCEHVLTLKAITYLQTENAIAIAEHCDRMAGRQCLGYSG